jgi:hypothetical protein
MPMRYGAGRQWNAALSVISDLLGPVGSVARLAVPYVRCSGFLSIIWRCALQSPVDSVDVARVDKTKRTDG